MKQLHLIVIVNVRLIVMNKDNEKIVSFFPAIQGEGRNGGQYVHFIRLFTAQCFANRPRCSFCDTVNRSLYKQEMNISDILEKVRYEPKKPSHYVITGGEPFNWDSRSLLTMMNGIRLESCSDGRFGSCKPKFDFETNGSYFTKERLTNDPYLPFIFATSNIITISPKLENSMKKGKYIDVYDYEALKDIQTLFPEKFDFKFVVNVESKEQLEKDFQSLLNFQSKANIPDENVWIMPMTPYHNKEMVKDLAEKVIDFKFNFSNRLHVQIWGSDIEKEV